MNLKWLFWTGLIAIIVFFSAVYFGIKYDWVNSETHSKPLGVTEKSLSNGPEMQNSSPAKTEILSNSTSLDNGAGLELIDEEPADPNEQQNALGSSELTIEEVVSQCQALSESIGVPQHKLEQAISECVDRNSSHLLADDDQTTDNERAELIREQCNVAITQKDLLSDEEIKLLVDECVASMSIN